MNKIIHYLGLDVHKDSVAVAIAVQQLRAFWSDHENTLTENVFQKNQWQFNAYGSFFGPKK